MASNWISSKWRTADRNARPQSKICPAIRTRRFSPGKRVNLVLHLAFKLIARLSSRLLHLMSLTPLSYSLIMMYKNNIYWVRDPFGNRPLTVGMLVGVLSPNFYWNAFIESAISTHTLFSRSDSSAGRRRSTSIVRQSGDRRLGGLFRVLLISQRLRENLS